jgi:hypothetical protein
MIILYRRYRSNKKSKARHVFIFGTVSGIASLEAAFSARTNIAYQIERFTAYRITSCVQTTFRITTPDKACLVNNESITVGQPHDPDYSGATALPPKSSPPERLSNACQRCGVTSPDGDAVTDAFCHSQEPSTRITNVRVEPSSHTPPCYSHFCRHNCFHIKQFLQASCNTGPQKHTIPSRVPSGNLSSIPVTFSP